MRQSRTPVESGAFSLRAERPEGWGAMRKIFPFIALAGAPRVEQYTSGYVQLLKNAIRRMLNDDAQTEANCRHRDSLNDQPRRVWCCAAHAF